MSEMTTRRQVETHDAIMRSQECSVNCKVSRGATVRLNVYTPLVLGQSERGKCSYLAQPFNLVNDFIPAIIPSSRISFGIKLDMD